MTNEEIVAGFEGARQVAGSGAEYWMARTLQELLKYDDWRTFFDVIDRACVACTSMGVNVNSHFGAVTKKVEIGSGAQRPIDDFLLSRFACHLIAMNGDPSKPEIAAAQKYFVLKTREMELVQKHLDSQQRAEIRDKIKDANKGLASTAKAAGVVEYGLFQSAGYVGLYGMTLKDVKQYKGIPAKDDLLDRAGSLELSANYFRVHLTKEALKKEGVHSEVTARETHKRIGKKVRKTIHEETGKLPENLPAEPSLKKIASARKKALKSAPLPHASN